jgi:hypothetical protein
MVLGSGIRDPGSGKNLFRIPGSKRHRIPDPQHWMTQIIISRKDFIIIQTSKRYGGEIEHKNLYAHSFFKNLTKTIWGLMHNYAPSPGYKKNAFEV